MKFKYNLGERILFRRVNTNGATEEAIGTITAIKQMLQQDGVKLLWDVFSTDATWPVTDSDILGTVTVKRAPAPRVRNRKKKGTIGIDHADPGADKTVTHMTNGKTDTDQVWCEAQ